MRCCIGRRLWAGIGFKSAAPPQAQPRNRPLKAPADRRDPLGQKPLPAKHPYGVPVPERLQEAIAAERDNLSKVEALLSCMVVSLEYQNDPLEGPRYPAVAQLACELYPRALEVLKRHVQLRDKYVAEGKIRHDHLFFLEDGSPIGDPEATRWRWNESLKKLQICQRGPYHARHSSVTWQLMFGKNLLWVAKQHGHSVEVMLRMYAAWIEGATDADIQAIKQGMDASPSAHARAASLAACSATQSTKKIVISPLLSPEFASSSASRKQGGDLSHENASENSGGEGGIRTHGPRKGTPVFKTGAFNRSATSPASIINELHELSKVNFMTRHAVF
jgi:hypothetical protein